MRKYAFELTLKITEFEAESDEHATELLNGYLDRLAEVEDEIIQWTEVDWTMYSDELDNVDVIEYSEPTS
jgi:uncharacterized protein (UPF0212 family)